MPVDRVPEEDVGHAVLVRAGHDGEVVGGRREQHAGVARDRRARGGAVADVRSLRRGRHQREPPRVRVRQVDVAHAVAARVHEVGGRGAKGDVLAAVVDRRLVGGAVAGLPRPPRGHEPRARAYAALVAERVLVDVGLAVAVARGQVGRVGGERHRVAGGRPARLRAAVTELAELGVVGVAVAGRAAPGGRGEEGRARQALVIGLAAEDAHVDLACAARRRAGHERLAGAAAGGEGEVGRAAG